PTLVQGVGLDVDAGAGARTQEVGGVVDADGEFPAIGHGVAGADAGGAFDDGRVDTAVDHAPRGVVVLTEFGMSPRRGGRDLIGGESDGGDEPARASRREIWQCFVRHGHRSSQFWSSQSRPAYRSGVVLPHILKALNAAPLARWRMKPVVRWRRLRGAPRQASLGRGKTGSSPTRSRLRPRAHRTPAIPRSGPRGSVGPSARLRGCCPGPATRL